MTSGSATAPDIRRAIDQFVAAFNVNDLDRVMTFFAENAVYRPGDGTEAKGPAAIRQAFAPQFNAAFGTMRFDEHDRLIDDVSRKAAIRWVCRHDLAGARTGTLNLRLQKVLVGLFVGPRFGWEGVDIFHFDAAGKIAGKFTYANYNRPQLRRDLGVVLHAESSSASPRATNAR